MYLILHFKRNLQNEKKYLEFIIYDILLWHLLEKMTSVGKQITYLFSSFLTVMRELSIWSYISKTLRFTLRYVYYFDIYFRLKQGTSLHLEKKNKEKKIDNSFSFYYITKHVRHFTQCIYRIYRFFVLCPEELFDLCVSIAWGIYRDEEKSSLKYRIYWLTTLPNLDTIRKTSLLLEK